ncbi:MAG: lipopolysaccharide biosynthesis protein [Acidobacteria bacterium]|nr:lipopolysaccharide biosynthesis protein [Acidobacteriota bacterium]
MFGHRELTLDDYWAMLKRRKWIILIPALVVPVLAYLVSLKLPNRYTSRTMVLIENQKVPETYVRSIITEDLSYRLSTMKEQILSRTRLQPIIDRFHLYEGLGSVDDKLMAMRKAVVVKPVLPDVAQQAGAVPGFSISFTYDVPRTAQQVCSEITSMFMEENLKARQQSAQGTTEFLEQQLQESKKKLDEQDARLAAFKTKYFGQLPEQEQNNMNLLNSANTQLDAISSALSRAQQDKTFTESMLSQQLTSWRASQKMEGSNDPEVLQKQLVEQQTHLLALRARYTEDHPDVIKAKSEIEKMRQRLREAEANAPTVAGDISKKPNTMEPASILQMRLQLQQTQEFIKNKTAEQARVEQQIRTLQGRVQLTPMVEEQYKAVTRDYQTALNFYNDLLAKKDQSQMAKSLELRQQGEQFRVMDPPNLPERPSFPNRPLIAAEGFGGGILLGLIIAFVLELFDKSLRTEDDIKFYLGLPSLAAVPTLDRINPAGNGARNWFSRKKDAAWKSLPIEVRDV